MSDSYIMKSAPLMYALTRLCEYELFYGVRRYRDLSELPGTDFSIRIHAAKDSLAAESFPAWSTDALVADIHYFCPDGTLAPDFFMASAEIWRGLYDFEKVPSPPTFEEMLYYLMPAKMREQYDLEYPDNSIAEQIGVVQESLTLPSPQCSDETSE